jgi:D-amino peptidase
MDNQTKQTIFQRVLEAFLRRTSIKTQWMMALRALTLHMLKGHAPNIFNQASLKLIFEESLKEISKISLALPVDLYPDDGMARIDAWFVLQERNLAYLPPQKEELKAYLQAILDEGYLVHSWLLGEIAFLLGIDVRLPISKRPLKDIEFEADLYWLTHLFLLETRYLKKQLPRLGWQGRVDELKAATPRIIENEYVDLGAEIAICLQLVLEHRSPEHLSLIKLITDHIEPDGSVVEPVSNTKEAKAHLAGAAMLALAGVEEFNIYNPVKVEY